MRIGLMGGTFRPIHYGHLMIAENAREQLHLDRVWFIPNNSSPFKVNQHTDDAFDRLNMLSLAIQDNPYFEINHIELTRSGISYTYQTLECLKESYPQEDFFFLMVIGIIRKLFVNTQPLRLPYVMICHWNNCGSMNRYTANLMHVYVIFTHQIYLYPLVIYAHVYKKMKLYVICYRILS